MSEESGDLKEHLETVANKYRNRINKLEMSLRSSQNDVAIHQGAHAQLVKWLRTHEPEVYKRAQKELAFGTGEDL